MGIKLTRAMVKSNVHKGSVTMMAILEQIPKRLSTKLSSNDFALLIDAIDSAYHNGKASAGAEIIDDNAVWINGLNRAIEWKEVGAEYTKVERHEGNMTVFESIKTKEGVLTPSFIE